jgi:hypothetical protein
LKSGTQISVSFEKFDVVQALLSFFFALNKYSLRAYLHHSLQPTILNDNVNQFKIGLESGKGYFTLKVKTMTLMSHFFCPQ